MIYVTTYIIAGAGEQGSQGRVPSADSRAFAVASFRTAVWIEIVSQPGRAPVRDTDARRSPCRGLPFGNDRFDRAEREVGANRASLFPFLSRGWRQVVDGNAAMSRSAPRPSVILRIPSSEIYDIRESRISSQRRSCARTSWPFGRC